jgi:hypothetical protein
MHIDAPSHDLIRISLVTLLATAPLAISCGDSEQTGGSAGAGGANASTGTMAGTGGAQGGAGGAGGPDAGQCPGASCNTGEICIAYRTVGGAVFMPDDAGACPPGRHPEPFGGGTSICEPDFAYRCVALRGCAGMEVSCACGQASCPTGYPACADPPANDMWIDPAAQLTCSLQAP